MTLQGPLLVLAGAGTGKTRVITYRIAELIRRGTVQERILAVTFTNKAAREMRERALHLLGKRPKGVKPPEISTFHALCVRVLRRHAERLGYPKEFAIYDRSDQETLARGALRDIRVSADTLRPGDLLHIISGWKSQGIRPAAAEGVANGDREGLAAAAYARYQTQLRASGAMDFDDLLLATEELFDKHPEARFAEATRFDHLLIDEYQDTNGPQYRIVKALASRHRNLCVVGDDDQSIYGWRGADVSHILNFQKDWPDAKVVRLEDNYRSKSPILEAANTLIAHNGSRHQKILRPFREGGLPPRMLRMENETLEAEAVIAEIRQRMEGVDESVRWRPSDVAILFRTNEQPRAFELELRRARVPYVLVGGMSFYDRKEVRDVLAYLRVIANPSDEVSLLRIINTPARGIGAGTVEVLMQVAVNAAYRSGKFCRRLRRAVTLLTARATAWTAFARWWRSFALSSAWPRCSSSPSSCCKRSITAPSSIAYTRLPAISRRGWPRFKNFSIQSRSTNNAPRGRRCKDFWKKRRLPAVKIRRTTTSVSATRSRS